MKIEYNGSQTWTVINSFGDCIFATDTERKAQNFVKRAKEESGELGECAKCGDEAEPGESHCDECIDAGAAIARGEFHDPDLIARDREEDPGRRCGCEDAPCCGC
jgi:hypothetical protein